MKAPGYKAFKKGSFLFCECGEQSPATCHSAEFPPTYLSGCKVPLSTLAVEGSWNERCPSGVMRDQVVPKTSYFSFPLRKGKGIEGKQPNILELERQG